ncbi:YciI family protein [Sphingomonas sp. BT-65]|uniref:YciI family protein n=1 Tax=Sphingomonas sp. BT-65 TaxID=2989821 RepID=UPI002235559E|nr:YciI family protein [Sphingomonas sp. BT-65]MCW4462999.1 YciI family protein [Sphingomonas sp. BT-65]
MHKLTRLAGIAAIVLVAMTGTGVAAQAGQEPAAQQQAARPMFAIVYRAGPAWKPGVPMKDQGLRDHFYYVKALHERGDIVYAGPMGPDGGLILVHAADQAAADAIVAADPAVKAGIFVGTARDFTPRFTGTGAAAAASR